MTALLVTLLLCIAVILLGAGPPGKPVGWIAIGLALLAMLIAMFGFFGRHG